MEDFVEFLSTGAIVLGLAMLLFALFSVPLYFISKYDCSKLGRNTGRETQYHFWGGGCLVRVNGQLIPSDNTNWSYRRINK